MEARVVGRHPLGLSFPSGHTSQTFFLMTLLIQTFRLGPFNAFFLYILAFLVGITRMYVGAHYPRDVIGGAMLGTVWGIMTSMLHFYLLGLSH
jgi:membrane-associated phospholipid phosphatase